MEMGTHLIAEDSNTHIHPHTPGENMMNAHSIVAGESEPGR